MNTCVNDQALLAKERDPSRPRTGVSIASIPLRPKSDSGLVRTRIPGWGNEGASEKSKQKTAEAALWDTSQNVSRPELRALDHR